MTHITIIKNVVDCLLLFKPAVKFTDFKLIDLFIFILSNDINLCFLVILWLENLYFMNLIRLDLQPFKNPTS